MSIHFIGRTLYLYYLCCRFTVSTAVNQKALCLLFLSMVHPAHLSGPVTDAAGMGCRVCRGVVRCFHQRSLNYDCSRERGREEGEPSLYLSWAGVTQSRGYHACQGLWPLITEETLSYFFFSHLISYPEINQPICQLPVLAAAESANKWVSEDLPAGSSVITQVPLPGLLPHTNLQ